MWLFTKLKMRGIGTVCLKTAETIYVFFVCTLVNEYRRMPKFITYCFTMFTTLSVLSKLGTSKMVISASPSLITAFSLFRNREIEDDS